jgi:hypothetical protein
MAEVDPGSEVYLGREGTGAAGVFQSPINVVGTLVQERRAKKKAENDAAVLAQKQDAKDRTDLDKFYANIDKPGIFQREMAIMERDKIKQKGDQLFMDPSMTIQKGRSTLFNDISEYNRRNARRSEIENAMKHNFALSKDEGSNIDTKFVEAIQKSYMNRDVDDMSAEDVAGITNHPRAYNAPLAITDIANDVKNQFLSQTDGDVRAGDFGLEWDQRTKKTRFLTYPSGPRAGQIQDNVVKNVLEQDPNISRRLRWDIAAEQVLGQKDVDIDKLSPEQINAVNERYDQIEFSNDPSVVLPIYDKVRKSLERLQQTETKDDLNFRGYSSAAATKKKNIPLRRTVIEEITSIFDSGRPSEEGLNAMQNLVGGKLAGYNVQDVEALLKGAKDEEYGTEYLKRYDKDIREKFPAEIAETIIKYSPRAKGKKTLRLRLRTGTEYGTPLEFPIDLDLTKPGVNRALNTILNTVPGAPKIGNEELYETEPDYLNFDEEDPLGINDDN